MIRDLEGSVPRPPTAIRRARPEDISLIEDFVDRCYGAGAPFKQRDRLLWQFVDSPFRPPDETDPSIFIALHDDEVVGTIGVQDGCARVDGRDVPMGWVVDVMIDPACRGMGLGHQLHERALEDRNTLITLTMAEATRRIAERAGAITLGSTREFVRPLRVSTRTVERFLEGKAANAPRRTGLIKAFNLSRVGPALLAMLLRCAAVLRRPSPPDDTDLQVSEVSEFPAEVDALWKDAAAAHPTFERSTRFLNWRFVRAPGLEYRRFLLWSGGVLRGYLVTRDPDALELPVGTVVDVLARPGDTEALGILLAHAERVLGPRCEYLEAAASSDEYRDALLRAGYFATRTMRPTIVCTNEELSNRLCELTDSWHFTKADHDWDQVHPA